MTRKGVPYLAVFLVLGAALFFTGCDGERRALLDERKAVLADCKKLVESGFRPIAASRDERFLGKVADYTANCRGGRKALAYRDTPWLDWPNYWGTGDASSRAGDRLTRLEESLGSKHLNPNGRGVDGAVVDLEYQRIELIRYNLFDNSGTFDEYVLGRDGVDGTALKVWDEMRLPPDHPSYAEVGGAGEQICRGELIRFRTPSGICNDIKNPLMGSTGMSFARNVEFEATFPRLEKNELARNRHGGRLGLLEPDPQVISRKLFTRVQSRPDLCNEGHGLPGWSPEARCDYKKAPFLNVLAAFWIQFMTHDWFSHLNEGQNASEMMPTGCEHKVVDGVEVPLTPEEVAELGCRPDDQMERATVAEDRDPPAFDAGGRRRLGRAYKTFANTTTAWWDASQLYGYDEVSRRRVKRDGKDPAKLLMVTAGERPGAGEAQGYLPLFAPGDPIHPAWAGQEATAFPDNWTIGLSFFHNVFAREHNLFVDEFRRLQAETPGADSGLRRPDHPGDAVPYRDVTDDELFEVTRLVVAAEIAKIHTIEWTTQLLYDEPFFKGLNANWHGLFEKDNPVSKILQQIVVNQFGKSSDPRQANQWYSVLASGAGIFGLGSHVYEGGSTTDVWSIANPEHVGGGVNHFGSPFNFPEEFVTVYRLHPLVPDLIEYRDRTRDPDEIVMKVPVVETFRGKATEAMRSLGLADLALSMGRQRLGLLTLRNHPRFLQNLTMERLDTPTKKLDVAALDILRDRERGIPRFNEFRRQYALKQLTSFDDFVDPHLAEGSPERREEERLAGLLREVYGRHVCDDSKVITDAQLNDDGSPITDCLGRPDGTLVDNVEDVDTVVGWLAESARPHGCAISETQIQVFILNASRRLFSDRFFTSSFRPEFYTRLGVAWVDNNGPGAKQWEPEEQNGHRVEVSPLKRVLLRTVPELAGELEHVINAFDPWSRDRGEYYSLEWKPRPDVRGDPAFAGD